MARPDETDAELAELLAAEAAFLAGNEAPAAAVRRRSGAAAAPQRAAPPAQETRGAAATREAAALPQTSAAEALLERFANGAAPRAGAMLGGEAAAGAMDDLSALDDIPSRPAATAVRMPRRGAGVAAPAGGAAAATASPRQREPPQPAAPGGPDDAPGHIIGAVMERSTGAPSAPAPPRAPAGRVGGAVPRHRFAPLQPIAPTAVRFLMRRCVTLCALRAESALAGAVCARCACCCAGQRVCGARR